MKLAEWYEKRVSGTALFLAIGLLSCIVAAFASFGPQDEMREVCFTVTVRHYGVDARELERTIAEPLETALYALPGARTIMTSVEYAVVRTNIYFTLHSKKDFNALYAMVSDAVYRVYALLPSSVQRPEIDTAKEEDAPVWMAAVKARSGAQSIDEILEKKVKPAFKKIRGAGLVEVYGLRIRETAIQVFDDKLALTPVEIETVGAYLARNDVLKSAGFFQAGEIRIPVLADGRYKSTEELAHTLIPLNKGTVLELGNIAKTEERYRTSEAIARVNGEQCLVLAVKRGSGANIFQLSSELAREQALWEKEGLVFTVLVDSGRDLLQAFFDTISAMLQGILLIALACFGVMAIQNRLPGQGSGYGASILGMLSVPSIVIVSAAVLVVMGYSIDDYLLAGLVTGLGAAVDISLLVIEDIAHKQHACESAEGIRALLPSLAGGSITTIIALAPLIVTPNFGANMKHVALGIAVVNAVSLVMVPVFLPLFLLWFNRNRKKAAFKQSTSGNFMSKTKRSITALLYRTGCALYRYRYISTAVCIVLSIGAILALAFVPIDSAVPEGGDSILFQAEFESGIVQEVSDIRITSVAKTVQSFPGVITVQTSAYRGYATMVVKFDSRNYNRDALIEKIRNISVEGGFIWTAAASREKRQWKVHIYGDESSVCEQLAKDLANAVSSIPLVDSVVLNFKEGAPDIVLDPQRDKLASLCSFFDLGRAVRTGIYGPVFYKRIHGGKETDARVEVYRLEKQGRDKVMNILLPDGTAPIASAVSIKEIKDTSRIYRIQRRRAATITVETGVIDPFVLEAEILKKAQNLDMPLTYAVHFDADALKASRQAKANLWYILMAVFGVFLVLAILSESFSDALFILFTVPPSLALPALLLALHGINALTLAAFIAVSGMVVNASVLLFDRAKALIRDTQGKVTPIHIFMRTMRSRFISLLATTLTTIAGAVPILFLQGDYHIIVRSLALVTFLGVGASFIVSISLLPVIIELYVKRKNVQNKEGQYGYIVGKL